MFLIAKASQDSVDDILVLDTRNDSTPSTMPANLLTWVNRALLRH